ncbi:hypothetical protein [Paludisphaera sp.]|uniref:hypothetical protein n=1 Tax=Paludisphaera sp. TaxID=2017432 RepID=UPI00301BAACE
MGETIPRRFGWSLAVLMLAAGLAPAADVDPAAPSTVTIHERGIRLDAALRALSEQTGNAVVDLRERQGAEATNPAIDLDLEAVPFLRALDEIAAKAGVAVTPSTGERALGIVPGGGAGPPVEYSGPFRVSINRIFLQRDFEADATTARITLAVGWEPRLRPMLLTFKAGGVEATDDRGRAVRPQVPTESGGVGLYPDFPSTEVELNLAAPERSAARLATLRFRAEVILPTDIQTFEFARLDQDTTIRQGRLSATLRGARFDEGTWTLPIIVDYPRGAPELESFRQGLFHDWIRLVKADGTEAGRNMGFAMPEEVDGRRGFEYLFTDVPGDPKDYRLIYEAPGAIVAVPIDVTFKDVALP